MEIESFLPVFFLCMLWGHMTQINIYEKDNFFGNVKVLRYDINVVIFF